MCIYVRLGNVKSSATGDGNINCLWGGGSCFWTENENGEYSWVTLTITNDILKCKLIYVWTTECNFTLSVSEYDYSLDHNLWMPGIGTYSSCDMLFCTKMSSVWRL